LTNRVFLLTTKQYVSPNPSATIEPLHGNPQIYIRDEVKPFESDVGTANHFLRTFTRRYPAPAKIFCSRELENGLTEYVKRELQITGGVFPSDGQLRERARDIMSMQRTACDDPVLLDKFKASLKEAGFGGIAAQQQPAPASSMRATADFNLDMDLDLGFDAPLPTSASMPAISVLSTELAAAAASSALNPTTTMTMTTLAAVPAAGNYQSNNTTIPAATDMDMDLDFNFTEQELNDILQDVSYSLGDNNNNNNNNNTQNFETQVNNNGGRTGFFM